MSHFNYGSRNGMATMLQLVRKLCKLYAAFSAGIISFINASSLTTEQKTEVIAWLNGASAVCAILETSVLVTYEN